MHDASCALRCANDNHRPCREKAGSILGLNTASFQDYGNLRSFVHRAEDLLEQVSGSRYWIFEDHFFLFGDFEEQAVECHPSDVVVEHGFLLV
jgi:hypothetical protein